MTDKEIPRLSRLTAILTQLQSKRLLTATEISARFQVSVRTIYRDIRALEAAGVPIFTEDGKGYALMEGYRLPPIMFTESEANALITVEQLVLQNKDASLVEQYSEAMLKIKSVLRQTAKDKADLLSKRIQFRYNAEQKRSSNYLSDLQLALTNFLLTKLDYHSPDNNATTSRLVEPFALYSTQENWLLLAYCRLRQEFRAFRLDRILHMEVLKEHFQPQEMNLEEYFEACRKNNFPPLTQG